MVKNLPARQETQVQSLSQEDTLEQGMANHSSILAWRIPWTEEPDRLQSVGSQRVRPNWSDLVSMQCTVSEGEADPDPPPVSHLSLPKVPSPPWSFPSESARAWPMKCDAQNEPRSKV